MVFIFVKKIGFVLKQRTFGLHFIEKKVVKKIFSLSQTNFYKILLQNLFSIIITKYLLFYETTQFLVKNVKQCNFMDMAD